MAWYQAPARRSLSVGLSSAAHVGGRLRPGDPVRAPCSMVNLTPAGSAHRSLGAGSRPRARSPRGRSCRPSRPGPRADRGVRRRGGGGGGSGPGPPRNRPTGRPWSSRPVDDLDHDEPPEATVTGKWSQAPALNAVVRLAVRGPLPSSTVSPRAGWWCPSRRRTGGGCRCSRRRTSAAAGPRWRGTRRRPGARSRSGSGARGRRSVGCGQADPVRVPCSMVNLTPAGSAQGRRRPVPGRERVALGAVVADPVALDPGAIDRVRGRGRRRRRERGPGPPRNRPERTAVWRAGRVVDLDHDRAAGGDGDREVEPGAGVERGREARGPWPLPSSTVMSRAGRWCPSRRRTGGACRCSRR